MVGGSKAGQGNDLELIPTVKMETREIRGKLFW